MNEALLKVEGVSKKFCRSLKRSLWYGMQDVGSELLGRRHGGNGELRLDEFWAVKDVSFELRRGECLGLIGHNGAGKTTLLRMINGLIKPDQGRIEVSGNVGALIALGAGFNPILTGRENIYVNASVLGFCKRDIDEKIDEIIEFAELGKFIDSPVQSYSSGMVVRLGFAVAVKTQPDILLLDEVLAVGDISFQVKCFNALSYFRDRGTAFVLVSHNMHQISRFADRVLYLNNGQVVKLDNVDSCIEKYHQDLEMLEPLSENGFTSWDKSIGSGKVTFIGGRFLNSRGEEVVDILAGDGVTLVLDYQVMGKIPRDPSLDILIRDQDGVLYQGTNNDAGQPFGEIPDRGSFHVHFPFLPVNVNWLDFFFCLLDKNTCEVYDWKRHFRLNVKGRDTHIGRLHIPVQWDVKQMFPSEHQ